MANESPPWHSDRPHSSTQGEPSYPALCGSTFKYTPVSTSGEEFRILIIHPEPTDKDDHSIRCSLVHKRFSETPAYESLSYMWGDQTIAYSGDVEVNGCSFPVGCNLGGALAQLRSAVDRLVWVDAICINQKDEKEKSLQIQLMPFIYERAKKCLIWLGETSADLDISVLVDHPWNETYGPQNKKKRGTKMNDTDTALLKHLANNPYWQRVWIIQEIGKSRRLEMMYGTYRDTFSAFTSRLKCVHGIQDCIPLRLQSQLDSKYTDGHKLQFLIESNASSLCQEPRDHIYGFVGLSTDGQTFPIDYSKSHYEVWKDSVLFKHSESKNLHIDILSFATLIKEKLGSATISDLDVLKDERLSSAAVSDAQSKCEDRIPNDIDLMEIAGYIMIPSRLVGRVAYIGPTYAKLVALPRTMMEWRLAINENVEASSRPQIREESDLFFERLESLGKEELTMAAPYLTLLAWKETTTPRAARFGYAYDNSWWDTTATRLSKDPSEFIADPDNGLSIGDGQRLFLLEEMKYLVNAENKLGSIGILPKGACVGDYIYQIHGITRAVVVRRAHPMYRIVGTALITETIQTARAMRETCEDYLPFQRADFDQIEACDRLDLYIDIAKAYKLLD